MKVAFGLEKYYKDQKAILKGMETEILEVNVIREKV